MLIKVIIDEYKLKNSHLFDMTKNLDRVSKESYFIKKFDL